MGARMSPEAVTAMSAGLVQKQSFTILSWPQRGMVVHAQVF